MVTKASTTNTATSISVAGGKTNQQNIQVKQEPTTPGMPNTAKTNTSTTTMVRKGKGRGKQTSTISVLDTIQDEGEYSVEVEGEEFDDSDSDATELYEILANITGPKEETNLELEPEIDPPILLPKGYEPEKYYPYQKYRRGNLFVNIITIGNAMGATIPVAFGQTRCNVLIDTGAMKSCMSQTFYQQLMLPTMRSIYTYQVKSATGSNPCPMGITGCEFKIGDKGYRTDSVVCKNLTRPCILGIDFLRKHNIFAGWTAEGKFKLISQQESLVESLEVLMDGPMICNKQGVTVPGKKLAVIRASIDIDKAMDGQMFEVKPNFLLTNEHPNLVITPMLHQVRGEKQECVPLTLLNLAEDESVFLRKGEILGHLEPCPITIEEIIKEDWLDSVESGGEEENAKLPLEKKFITSPAEINTHRKVNLQDAQISARYKEQFRLLCKEFEDIFSKDSTDIGKTPLITMDIDTGNSPPVCQKPYNLPLKHREWVQKELETLEKDGVIVRSISPWASPIIVVPKKTG